jgi:hypothetical protein
MKDVKFQRIAMFEQIQEIVESLISFVEGGLNEFETHQ